MMLEEHNTKNGNGHVIEGWLTEQYDYDLPERGQIREGIILEKEEAGLLIDVGLKHDGFVPRSDIERMQEMEICDYKPGQEVKAQVERPADREGELILSLAKVEQQKDWDRAETYLQEKETWEGEIVGYNRGGLLTAFGQLQGFIPASQLWDWHQKASNLSTEERKEKLSPYVGQTLTLQIIEADRKKERLILSERKARRAVRQQQKKQLLESLSEGDIRHGTVTQLTKFGAFVDLGGADGMIHVSELAWFYVQHPSDVLSVGDEIDVYVLNLDHKRKRIDLSLKRIQPDPWETAEDDFEIGQVVTGTVTSVVDFGAFVTLDNGLEGLVHVSELADGTVDDPELAVEPGTKIKVRILRIDTEQRRLSLSRQAVPDEERLQELPQDEPEPEIILVDEEADEPDAEPNTAEAETEPNETPAAETEEAEPAGKEKPNKDKDNDEWVSAFGALRDELVGTH